MVVLLYYYYYYYYYYCYRYHHHSIHVLGRGHVPVPSQVQHFDDEPGVTSHMQRMASLPPRIMRSSSKSKCYTTATPLSPQ